MKTFNTEEICARAAELFMSGYNCAQALYGAFAPVVGVEEETALKISSPFGGGFGRLREVCGAFSGMTLVLGHFFGYSDPASPEKNLIYPREQELARRFEKIRGSIVCREILQNKAEVGGNASPRTREYYATRPCVYVVEEGARILAEYLKEEGVL